MSTQRHPPRGAASMRPSDERYAVVVTTKAEGMEVVLHGLRKQRAERIATRKNRNRDETTNVQPVPERELERRSDDPNCPANH